MFQPIYRDFTGQKECVGHREDDRHEGAVQEEEVNPEDVCR